jgi:hypothetical protein
MTLMDANAVRWHDGVGRTLLAGMAETDRCVREVNYQDTREQDGKQILKHLYLVLAAFSYYISGFKQIFNRFSLL